MHFNDKKSDMCTQFDNSYVITVLFCCLQIGEIWYKARTDRASSGSPVMVAYEFENESVPMIVGVHSGFSRVRKKKINFGSFLLPFLDDFNQYIQKPKDEIIMEDQKFTMGNQCFVFTLQP